MARCSEWSRLVPAAMVGTAALVLLRNAVAFCGLVEAMVAMPDLSAAVAQ